jgi:hypothetical protein
MKEMLIRDLESEIKEGKYFLLLTSYENAKLFHYLSDPENDTIYDVSKNTEEKIDFEVHYLIDGNEEFLSNVLKIKNLKREVQLFLIKDEKVIYHKVYEDKIK